MSWKKASLLFVIFVGLLLAFILTEEKSPESNEISFWKIDFDRINYTHPQNTKLEKFISESFSIQRVSMGLKENPIFLMHGKDSISGKEYTFEAGYAIKNLFSDLSVLKTKTMTDQTLELTEKFLLNEASPALEFFAGDKLQKKILLGKENKDNTGRYALADGFIISIHSFTVGKFTSQKEELREKQYLPISGHQIKRATVNWNGTYLELENRFTVENSVTKQDWYKKTGKMSRLSPSTSSRLDSLLRAIQIELYPDTEIGGGIEIIGELTKDKELATLEIEITNGKKYKISIYPPTNIQNKDYFPGKKELEGIFVETPAYLQYDHVRDLGQFWNTIKEEKEWQEPKKK